MRKVSPEYTTGPETEIPQARLVKAAAHLWASHGYGRMAAHQVAVLAGLQPSAVDNDFGAFDTLLEASLNDLIDRSRAWWQARLAPLDGRRAPNAEAAGFALANLIDELCVRERDMVFAWFECQAMAARKPAFAGVAARWHAVWRDAWGRLAAYILPPEARPLLYPFADGELCLHRVAWQPTEDRACLFETCAAWVRLLSDGHPGPMPLREALWARCENPPPLPWADDSLEAKIALAAADIVGASGVGGVTPEAVAAEAGLGLDEIARHFATSDELVYAAFAAIYGQIIGADQRTAQPIPPGAYAAGVARLVAHADAQANFLSLDEFTTEAARNPLLTRFGGTLRYARGRTLSRTLPGLPSALAGALISSSTNGLIRQARFVSAADRAAWAETMCLNLLRRAIR